MLVKKGLSCGIKHRHLSNNDLMQHEPKEPHIHLLKVELHQIFRHENVLLQLRRKIIHSILQLPNLLFGRVSNEQRLANEDPRIVDVKVLDVQIPERFE